MSPKVVAGSHTFKDSIKRIDPIHTRLNDTEEVEFSTKFLNPQQRLKLHMVRNYAKSLQVILLAWWAAEAKKD